MPIYEYRCKQCRRKSSHLFRTFSDTPQPACTHCGSSDLARLMSTFTVLKPWDAGLNLPSSETMGDFDEDDPASTADWMEGMRRDMGEGFGSGEMDDWM